jgi:hypothetical protein
VGNTKTYYIEGELLKGVTIEQFREKVYQGFHSTYCVAEIVEAKGGYLGQAEDDGPYVVAAIHSYSMVADFRPLVPLFKAFTGHRVDWDWSDIWVYRFSDGVFRQQRIDVPPGGAECQPA